MCRNVINFLSVHDTEVQEAFEVKGNKIWFKIQIAFAEKLVSGKFVKKSENETKPFSCDACEHNFEKKLI